MTLKMMEEGIVKEMMTTKMRMTFLMMTEENCMMKSMSPLMVWKLNQKHLTVLLILHQLSSPSRPLLNGCVVDSAFVMRQCTNTVVMSRPLVLK